MSIVILYVYRYSLSDGQSVGVTTKSGQNCPGYHLWEGPVDLRLRSRSAKLWKFVKELVILFHRISAAPWGHVVSIIKRASSEDSSSFFPLPPLLATGPYCSSPRRQNVFDTLNTIREPRAMNTRAKIKGTRITTKFLQAFYLQNLTL